jgi:SAM-dependent methyltransferase
VNRAGRISVSFFEDHMAEHVCPWWVGYLLIIPLRRISQNPRKILSPYAREGMTVLEPGPGMGFFTLELAKLVGSSGRVIAVDIQSKMLEKLQRRAGKRGLLERIEARLVKNDSLAMSDLRKKVDFALAFATVHEMPGGAPFFREVAEMLKPGGLLLLAEPRGHVKMAEFEGEVQAAADAGLVLEERPEIWRSYAALLRKPAEAANRNQP